MVSHVNPHTVQYKVIQLLHPDKRETPNSLSLLCTLSSSILKWHTVQFKAKMVSHCKNRKLRKMIRLACFYSSTFFFSNSPCRSDDDSQSTLNWSTAWLRCDAKYCNMPIVLSSPFLACTPIHAEALTTSAVPHYTACSFKGSEKRPKHQCWHVTENLQKPITKDLPTGGHKKNSQKKNSQFNEPLSRISENYVAKYQVKQKYICMYDENKILLGIPF